MLSLFLPEAEVFFSNFLREWKERGSPSPEVENPILESEKLFGEIWFILLVVIDEMVF